MNKKQEIQLDILPKLKALIGKVRAVPLFTSYGICAGNAMFGIYQNKVLYIKAEGELADALIKLGAIRYNQGINANLTISRYFWLPREIETNTSLYRKILLTSIQQIVNHQIETFLQQHHSIRSLPNLDFKDERRLKSVGIENSRQLYAVGPAKAYLDLKEKKLVNSDDFFWRATAALRNKPLDNLTEKERSAALMVLQHEEKFYTFSKEKTCGH